jgi:hypothetical protein
VRDARCEGVEEGCVHGKGGMRERTGVEEVGEDREVADQDHIRVQRCAVRLLLQKVADVVVDEEGVRPRPVRLAQGAGQRVDRLLDLRVVGSFLGWHCLWFLFCLSLAWTPRSQKPALKREREAERKLCLKPYSRVLLEMGLGGLLQSSPSFFVFFVVVK